MEDNEFEWNDAKAAGNLEKHGVSFAMARAAFDDVFGVEWLDDTQDTAEPRFALLAMAHDRLLFVAYTQRAERIRLIMARKALTSEYKRYHAWNRQP